jgi:hypothetical protein
MITIDIHDLELVNGGQSRTSETEGEVSRERARVRHSTSSTEPNGYLRCMNDSRRDAGWFQRWFNPSGVQQRAREACAGQYGSPENPERAPN